MNEEQIQDAVRRLTIEVGNLTLRAVLAEQKAEAYDRLVAAHEAASQDEVPE